ncbi:glycosyltransferase [Aeromonas veronii]|uniref:glycosyltransferase n=1 Tax=Aeromonas veronii TaxID=654 RepID=UPI003D19B6D2
MIDKIAVIMSVYSSDKALYLDASLNSIFSQSYQFFDIYLQVDGDVDIALRDVIDLYCNRFSNLSVEYFDSNMGLAWQLNRAITRLRNAGDYQFIARMDADDICFPDRFKIQIDYFKSNPSVAVLGSSILEFYEDGRTFVKLMHKEHVLLAENIIKRCPFNHPTVMFNMLVLSFDDIEYDPSLMNTQDYYLWVDLLAKGFIFSNISVPLLKFRVNSNFHSRRGIKKAKNEFFSRVYAMKKLGVFNFTNVTHTLKLFALRLSPQVVKEFAYKHFR